MRKDTLSKEERGERTEEAISNVIQLCQAARSTQIRGEGGERAFRSWLSDLLFKSVLDWNTEHVRIGERFDILTIDGNDHPVCTIETKDPAGTITPKDREDFETRLSTYHTLQVAYITNGHRWERVDLVTPGGIQQIGSRAEWTLGKHSADETAAFFEPLLSGPYHGRPTRYQQPLTSQSPSGLHHFASNLNSSVGELAEYLRRLFDTIRRGTLGQHAQSVTISLFDHWCEQSLVATAEDVAQVLIDTLTTGAELDLAAIAKVLTALGFDGPTATGVAESIAVLPPASRTHQAAVREALWPLYSGAVGQFASQTAHVIVGRALLYRIGEDRDVFPRAISRDALDELVQRAQDTATGVATPALDALNAIRTHMSTFLTTIYKSGTFDWWVITNREVLDKLPKAALRRLDEEWEAILLRTLRMLDSYSFIRVDFDVWQNIYQDYLPTDERQRLGGFYTPERLVEFVLDQAGYLPDSDGLAEAATIDLACGSGAFVVAALSRLIHHLQDSTHKLPIMRDPNAASWQRAQAALTIVSSNLHAVDIHPFAAFLTTMNTLFVILDLYVDVRSRNPDFELDIDVFAYDSLEKPDGGRIQPELFEALNSRVQLTEDAFQRFSTTLSRKFDFVFGNPPWGGILKGSLSPIYGAQRKGRWSTEYPHSARGKYDIYGLFIERAMQLLKENGVLALLTQDTFMDASWAQHLRSLLAREATLKYIIDLNPFGQLFFGALNAPCILVAKKSVCPDDEECLIIRCSKPKGFAAQDVEGRRSEVIDIVGQAIAALDSADTCSVGFASGQRVRHRVLRNTAKKGWHYVFRAEGSPAMLGWRTSNQLLEAMQGVTVGGEDCQDLFLIPGENAAANRIEGEFVHGAVKGRDVARWRLRDTGLVFLYPYRIGRTRSAAAFEVDHPQLNDALDFDVQLDDRERDIVRAAGLTRAAAATILQHRQALGLVSHGQLAAYLVQHYDQLSERRMESRRQWYEFHRQRDPVLMKRHPKLVSPRLARTMRVGLDVHGVLPQDSCVCLVRSTATAPIFDLFRRELSTAIGKEAQEVDVMRYCLAFLNSNFANYHLRTGRTASAKGSFSVNEDLLGRIRIPPPSLVDAKRVIDLVIRLGRSTRKETIESLENELAAIVDGVLPVPGTVYESSSLFGGMHLLSRLRQRRVTAIANWRRKLR